MVIFSSSRGSYIGVSLIAHDEPTSLGSLFSLILASLRHPYQIASDNILPTSHRHDALAAYEIMLLRSTDAVDVGAAHRVSLFQPPRNYVLEHIWVDGRDDPFDTATMSSAARSLFVYRRRCGRRFLTSDSIGSRPPPRNLIRANISGHPKFDAMCSLART